LGALDERPSAPLENALDLPVSRLCDLANELKARTPNVDESHVYFQYVRLIGAWLWGSRRRRPALRLAACAAASAEEDSSQMWRGRQQAQYPESDLGGAWRPVFISTYGQTVAPFYIGRIHPFMESRPRRHFDEVITRIRSGRINVSAEAR
jgi:hypothetical protein